MYRIWMITILYVHLYHSNRDRLESYNQNKIMNRSEIFKNAHSLVSSYRINFATYRETFSFCLKRAYKTASIKTLFTSEAFAVEVKKVDPRISMVVSGNFITGTFRGKTSENFKYDFCNRQFVFNNANYAVTKAFNSL